jgi:hypothetical protein
MATDPRAVTVTVLVLRLAGAGLTVAMAAIHLRLWADGYRELAAIGPLFLLNGILGGLLALALLAAPARLLRPVAGLAAAFVAGTLGALFLSLTVGLFGFTESWRAEFVTAAVVVEAAAVAVLTALAVAARHRR